MSDDPAACPVTVERVVSRWAMSECALLSDGMDGRCLIFGQDDSADDRRQVW